MTAKLTNLITAAETDLEIHRFMIMEDNLLIGMMPGYREDSPKRGSVYTIEINDVDTGNTIIKTGVFETYNYVLDKDGDNQTVEADNSFTFRVV